MPKFIAMGGLLRRYAFNNLRNALCSRKLGTHAQNARGNLLGRRGELAAERMRRLAMHGLAVEQARRARRDLLT
jgi:hypothetical protein